jgi:hypothetical protein
MCHDMKVHGAGGASGYGRHGGYGGYGAGGAGGGPFNAGPNPELGKWSDGIENAAAASGMDPNLIAAMVWAESRGNPNERSTNADGTTDLGLMQISQERWENDVCPNLSNEDRARIQRITGKSPEQLDMNNPQDNLIGGSFEIKQHIAENGGDVRKGLNAYVSGEPDGGGPYADNVLEYLKELENGQRLSEDPFGSP